jgi:eukaryotic-like serine/threonine-protein kinase
VASDSSMNSPVGVQGTKHAREERVRWLFAKAIELEGPDRSTWLERLRLDEPEVGQEVVQLLGYHDQDDSLLDRPVASAVDALISAPLAASGLAPLQTPMPARIGSYQIVQELGHGGMGVVYEAEQEFPKRRVALKLIRPELVSPELLKRFTHEAETLGLLQHPGIAQLYQAGLADEPGVARQPYIAMELVRGEGEGKAGQALTLSRYVREHALDTRGKLVLLQRIAQAIEHAHRRGVIHRDLKPGNILVDATGQPKILDFGIARLVAASPEAGAQKTLVTSAGQILGTLGYMSPEQLAGDSSQIDTRTDVYSLGVVLHELLAGELPIDVTKLNVAQAAIAVRDNEPRRLGLVSPEFAGDIEAIVGKALEKSAPDRYASAAELAADIERHLTNRPVEARPQSMWYQFTKFARRHKALTLMSAASIALLVGSTIWTSWLAVRETRAHEAAAAQTQRAEKAMDLMSRLFMSATPEFARGKDLTMREFLEAASKEVERSNASGELAAAESHVALGRAFYSQGDRDRALMHGERASLMLADVDSSGDRTRVTAIALRMLCLTALHRANEAVTIGEETLPWATTSLGGTSRPVLDLMLQLGQAHAQGNQPERGIQLLREAQARIESHDARAEYPELEVHGRHMLARALLNRGGEANLLEAIPLIKSVIESRTKQFGEDHPRTLSAVQNLGLIYSMQGKEQDAIDVLTPAVSIAQHVMGPRHPSTTPFYIVLAQSHERLKQFDAAIEYRRLCYQYDTMNNPPTSQKSLGARMWLISTLIKAGRCDEAEPLAKEQMELVEKANTGDNSSNHTRLIGLNHRFQIARCLGDHATMRALAPLLMGSSHEKEVNKAMAELDGNTAPSTTAVPAEGKPAARPEGK